MNLDDQAALMQYWKTNVEDAKTLPTQYPNSKEDFDKTELWCELSMENEVRALTSSRRDISDGNQFLGYDETGDFVITIYDNRGEGTGDIQAMIDDLKEIFTDRFIGSIEFYQARELPIVPVDEQFIVQVFCPFETSFEEKQKGNIP